MRLLDTETLQFREFVADIPKYAILSHRWEEDEVSFETFGMAPKTCKGYRKVKDFCEQARKDEFSYAWVDTCCIDKKSSAELSEAINSMYRWYQRAAICYVYMSDVEGMVGFENSAWFTRGWTLQELLAPREMHFFDRKWVLIASKDTLVPQIEVITGIPKRALLDFEPSDYCTAWKMSWSASRKTTREEDRAYCLLGIFNVNMPLLYGEGVKAFQRLQERIMETSTDLSIFLWYGSACEGSGMLAADPSCFSVLPDRLTYDYNQKDCKTSRGWTMNNAGMSMKALILPHILTDDLQEIFLLFLHDPFNNGHLAIFLEKDRAQTEPSYRRATVDGRSWISMKSSRDRYLPSLPLVRQLFITRDRLGEHHISGTRGFNLRCQLDQPLRCMALQRPADAPEAQLQNWTVIRDQYQETARGRFHVEPVHGKGLIGYLLISISNDVQVLIVLGFDHDFRLLSIIIPFCKSVCYDGLDASDLLDAYDDLIPGDDDSYEKFDSISHIIASCGTSGYLKYSSSYLSITLSSFSPFGDAGKHDALIDFNTDEFFQEYSRVMRRLKQEKDDTSVENRMQRLREIESEFFPKRREVLHMLW